MNFKSIVAQLNTNSSYLIFSITGSSFLFFKQLLYSSYLGADDFGLYSIFLLIYTYGSYSIGLGLHQGLLRFLPEGRMQHKNSYVDMIRNNVTTVSLCISIFESFAFIVLIFLLGNDDSQLRNVLLFAVVYTIFNMQINLFTVDLIGNLQFSLYAKFQFLRNFLSFFLGMTLLVLGFRLFSILFLEVMLSFILLYIIKKLYISNVRYQLNRFKDVVDIIKKGIGFWGVDFSKNILSSIDRVAIATIFPLTIIGSYSFIMIIFGIVLVISGIISTLLKPLFIRKLTMYADKKQIYNEALIISLIMLVLCLVTVGTSMKIAEWAIISYFPEYQISLWYLPYVALACIFYIANIYESILLAFDAGKEFFKVSVSISIVYLGIVAILVIQEASILSFLILFAGVQLVSLIANTILARKLAYIN